MMQNTEQAENERDRQLDGIIAQYYRLADAGEVTEQSDFILRNPEFASELRDFFSDARLLHSQDHGDPLESVPDGPLALDVSLPLSPPSGSFVRYFGEYEILEELGAGRMGVVYKARQSKPKRIVALKMIRAGKLANSIDLKRFEAEAKAAARLLHPGIVSVHEVGVHDGQHFYTMDYVEGGNLSRLYREKPVPAKHAVKLVRQLAESMHYAHLTGIVHRDLKPANILLTAQGKPRISDFGLAKRVRDDDESQTAGYMSPEQASGKSRLVGPLSDVYSLGAVLYALLTSRAPFVGESPSDTINQVLQKEPTSPRKLNPSIPRDLENICLKCLEKEPHKRYGSAKSLAANLELFLAGKPFKARPVYSLERGYRWCRQNATLTALVALAVLVFLCMPIVMFLQVIATVNEVQSARGPVVADLISRLQKYPSFAVTPILNHRFADESESHRKRNLAFALAGYGEMDADYLVSQIDAIDDADTHNYVTALLANPTTAHTALKAEALKCSDKPLWRRKARLAIAALGLGKTELALDVCAFENRPDPEQRTWFIDEYRRWDLDLRAVLAAVRNSDSPALRSGVCLGVGQIAAETISESEKRLWESLASQWFVEHADTSTHSAAGWLLRRWKLPLPVIPYSKTITPQRYWFVNSVGATMLRIRPETPAPDPVIPDPIEKYRQQLLASTNITPAEMNKPQIRLQNAIAYFYTGNHDRALEDLNFLIEHEPGEALSTVLQYRTLTLAHMGRADDARQSLAKYLDQKVHASHQTSMEMVVAALLDDIPQALRQLETAGPNASWDPITIYNLACAAAVCAQVTLVKDTEQSQRFTKSAIELLEAWASRGHKNENLAQEPDFAILHDNVRFKSILAQMEKNRKINHEIWVGDREVTRGQFEQFLNDANYRTTEKPEKPTDWWNINDTHSPTPGYPALLDWYDAVLYCNWLSLREGLLPCYERTGTKESESGILDGPTHDAWRLVPGTTGYRLLDEAEWEYVCRAGTTTNYSSGDDEALLVSYCQMYPSKTSTLCGEKLPNAWGLHDVHGNVMEWCWDSFSNAYKNISGWGRVLRGGSHIGTSECQSKSRVPGRPGNRLASSHCGLRLALSSPSRQLADVPHKPVLPDSRIIRSKDVENLKFRRLNTAGNVRGPGLTSAQHSSASPWVLVGGHDRLAKLLNLESSQEMQVFRGHSHAVWSVAESPDRRTVVTGSEDKTLRYWDVATGKELDRFTAGGIFSCVRYSADGSQVFATNWDRKVRVWRISDGKLGKPLEFTFAAPTLDLALLPEGNRFVVGNTLGQILLCDVETGAIQKTFIGHSGWVHSVAVVNEGDHILSASHDSTLRLWKVSTAKTERLYVGHSGIVNEVRVLSDGKRFVSCGADRTVRLWDIASRRSLGVGIGGCEYRGLSIAADGKSCLTAGLDGALWQWHLPELTEPSSDATDEVIPKLKKSREMQVEFNRIVRLSVSPMDVFIEYDQTTDETFYGVDWGPADGSVPDVRWGMLDNQLNEREADLYRKGFKRMQVKAVTTKNGKRIHIGLWKKTRTASDTDRSLHIPGVIKQENQPIEINGRTPSMLLTDAFQKEFSEKVLAKQIPRDVFAARDPRTNKPLYGIVWGPADGGGFMVRHGISDEQLNRYEAEALQKGLKRKRVSTVNINGVSLHIGLWVKTKSAPQQ